MSLTVSASCVATSVSNRLLSILNGNVCMQKRKIMSRIVLSSPPQTPKGTTVVWVVMSQKASRFLPCWDTVFGAGLQRTTFAFEVLKYLTRGQRTNASLIGLPGPPTESRWCLLWTFYESSGDDGCDWSILIVDKIIIISTRHRSR